MLREDLDELLSLYNQMKREIRRENPHLYERWKAGGFIVDSDIMSMYPNLEQVVEQLEPEEEVWEQIADVCNCSEEKARELQPKVMALVTDQAYSVDRAIEEVFRTEIGYGSKLDR